MPNNELENIENTGADTRSTCKKPCKIGLKNRFGSKRIALIGLFVALSYAVSFLEIPLPLFGAGFLKLDFGNVFIVLLSFLLGPFEATVACLLKESLRCLTSSSLCAGELANFIVTTSYLLLPSIAYCYRKNIKTVLVTLVAGGIIATGAALLANRFIVFPVYAYVFGGTIFGMTVIEAFSAFWLAVLLFNLIKTSVISILTLLLYKRLSNFLKKIKI